MKSAIDLEILLHYNKTNEMQENLTPMYVTSLDYLVIDGILEFTDEKHIEITQRGRAWLNMLLATPYPKQAWIDDHDEIVSYI